MPPVLPGPQLSTRGQHLGPGHPCAQHFGHVIPAAPPFSANEGEGLRTRGSWLGWACVLACPADPPRGWGSPRDTDCRPLTHCFFGTYFLRVCDSSFHSLNGVLHREHFLYCNEVRLTNFLSWIVPSVLHLKTHLQGHLAGSVGGACNSRSPGPEFQSLHRSGEVIVFKKLLANPRSPTFSPVLFPRSFTVSHFTFRSVMHFESTSVKV